MFAFHLYLPWVSEIRFTETIGWKAFLKRPLFIAIYLFCSEYCYHSLPQKEGGRRDTSLMFCRQDFFELKSQMRKFSGLFAMDGFRHRLHCKPLLCSLSAFHYTRKHPCLPTRDWPSARDLHLVLVQSQIVWIQFTAQSEMPIHNLGPRDVHTCYFGEVLCVPSICPRISRYGTNQ